MRGHQSERVVRWAGFGLGLTLVISLLVVLRIPSGDGSVGADVTFISLPPGELQIENAGPFLQINDMRPGTTEESGPSGSVHLTNIAPGPVEVRYRATPSTTTMSNDLQVSIRAGRDDLFRGPLASLGGWSPRSFYLGAGASTELDVAAWLPSGSNGYQGVIDDVTLEFRVRGTGS